MVLPDGRAPFAVGSGSHRWTVDAPGSQETLRELSLASDLGEVLDDREAYVAVMTAIRSGKVLRSLHRYEFVVHFL